MASAQTILPKVTANFTAAKIIGLISDTHIPSKAACVPKEVFKIFENADYIIHAGDLVALSVIDELEQIAPVLAVHGNMDGPEVSSFVPAVNSLKICDKKIGVVHDPSALFSNSSLPEIAEKNGFDVLVYGHTHTSSIVWEGKILLINPGSPLTPTSPLNKASVALLKVAKDSIVPEIINLK
jgi:uncharacterized protein